MPIVGNPAAINNLPASFQGVFCDYIAGGTILAGAPVIFTATGTVTTTTTANSALVAGVATENAVSGEAVNVCTHGVGPVTVLAAAITSGQLIATSGTAGSGTIAGALAGLGHVGIVGTAIVANGSAAGTYLAHINPAGFRGV